MATTARGRAKMDTQGRVTLPAEVRRALHLEPGDEFEVEVVDGKIILAPDALVRRQDAWAYTPEHRALAEHAREGRVYRLGRDDLARMIADADREG